MRPTLLGRVDALACTRTLEWPLNIGTILTTQMAAVLCADHAVTKAFLESLYHARMMGQHTRYATRRHTSCR